MIQVNALQYFIRYAAFRGKKRPRIIFKLYLSDPRDQRVLFGTCPLCIRFDEAHSGDDETRSAIRLPAIHAKVMLTFMILRMLAHNLSGGINEWTTQPQCKDSPKDLQLLIHKCSLIVRGIITRRGRRWGAKASGTFRSINQLVNSMKTWTPDVDRWQCIN